MNPARWFGPACVVSDWALPGVYALGPIAGVALAVVLRRVGPMRPPTPLTGKLFHDPSYRSVFRHDRVPSRVVERADAGENL